MKTDCCRRDSPPRLATASSTHSSASSRHLRKTPAAQSRPRSRNQENRAELWRLRRTPLAAALSGDDGQTWKGAKFVESDPDGWFCYIAVEPLDDGTVLLGYCAYDNLAHSRIIKVPVLWFCADT